MFAQFQSRYPAGSLISELLQIHEGNFIVRVVAQSAGVPLATGMAAATTIEQAEDQARLRALSLLGVHPPTYESRAQLMESNETGAVRDQARLQPAIAQFQPPDIDSSPEQADWMLPEEVRFEPPAYEPLVEEEPKPEPAITNGRHQTHPSRSSTRAVRSTAAQPTPPPSEPTPLDLSDIIAQTSVELKRLGWNESRGRTYLQRTYGKRSRQQLTDEELLDFLHYLQDEPSPGDLSF